MSQSSGKQSGLSQPNEQLTEADIESIWNAMKRPRKGDGKVPSPSKRAKEKKGPSIDTTPTTDYSGNLFPLHPETLEEELRLDKDFAKMTGVLRTKKMKPKSYLPQVILYDNMSHDRLLEIRLHDIRHAHEMAEKRAKRRHEKFLRALERKQDDWSKRDARAIAKLEPENASELSFAFGRLYNKPDHPYQDAVLSLTQPPQRVEHARRRPIVLPDVTRRPIYDDEEPEDKTFVTKLPKLQRSGRRRVSNGSGERRGYSDREMGLERSNGGGHQKREKRRNDWTADVRFHTLTSLLDERYSAKKRTNELKQPV
ncbi:uncharacterized protein LOC108950011 [Ciona intestinalis]